MKNFQNAFELKQVLKRFFLMHSWSAKIIGRKYFGLNNLDELLVPYMKVKNGYFVELGANDGITQSNTKHFELFENWSGVLIEPSPSKINECIKNRSKRNFYSQSACVSSDFEGKSIDFIYSNLMSVTLGENSDLEDRDSHLEKGLRYLRNNEKQYRTKVNARTLTSILDEANSPKVINLLSLDVEGSELEVLKGIDHQKYRFKYICVEARNSSRMKEFLTSVGYELEVQLTKHDYLFRDTNR